MALSLAAATTAVSNGVNDALRLQLHTGAPGPAGTANQFGDTSQQVITWAAAANGARAASNTPTWASLTAAGTITHASMWTTGGAYRGSLQLTNPKTVDIGDAIAFTSIVVSITNDG